MLCSTLQKGERRERLGGVTTERTTQRTVDGFEGNGYVFTTKENVPSGGRMHAIPSLFGLNLQTA